MGFLTRDVETQLTALDAQLSALATQLARFERHFTAALIQMESRIMANLDDLSTALDALKVDFETYKAGVDAAVQAALANASAAEVPAIQAIADKIAAIDAEIKGT